MEQNDNINTSNKPVIDPSSPKGRLIRLVVGMIIIILGIVIFNYASKLYSEAEAKDKAAKEQTVKAPEDSISKI